MKSYPVIWGMKSILQSRISINQPPGWWQLKRFFFFYLGTLGKNDPNLTNSISPALRKEPGTCLGPGCCWGGLRAILSCCGTSWKCGEPKRLEHWNVYTTFDRYTNGFLQRHHFFGEDVLCVFFFPLKLFSELFLLDSF